MILRWDDLALTIGDQKYKIIDDKNGHVAAIQDETGKEILRIDSRSERLARDEAIARFFFC